MKHLVNTIFAAFILIFSASMVGCGDMPAANQDAAVDCSTPEQQRTSTCQKQAHLNATNDDYFSFEGYISPLNLMVNDVSYVDSEDFYTSELKRLRKETLDEYPEYEVFFDAQAGLKDFKKGMSVFLVASNDSGVASESVVDAHGKFSFNLPPEAAQDELYTLRASKRVGVRLVGADDEIYLCYNLYAESEVTLDKSVILRTFKTTPTEYNCSTQDRGDGIQIPRKPTNVVKKGQEPAEPAVEEQVTEEEKAAVLKDAEQELDEANAEDEEPVVIKKDK